MSSLISGSQQDEIDFITITRGGGEGLIAVISINGEDKYYESEGLKSLLNIYTEVSQQIALKQAIAAVNDVNDLDTVPEFEGGLPVQGSLF